MTQSRIRVRRIALALCATAAVLSVSPIVASAQDNGPTDPGVRCAAKIGPGQYEFYVPGERATDVNGNKWVCGPDGQWFRDYSSLVVKTTFVKSASIAVSATAVAAR